uniref:Protein root UVB sensitive 4 n=1 Tax=Kalanchoe fedtschenkoi TaxID=63787 RepID=A0A7N0UY04_KALFE
MQAAPSRHSPWVYRYGQARVHPRRIRTASVHYGYDNRLGIENISSPQPNSFQSLPAALPLVIRTKGTALRYFWDGSRLQLVPLDVSSFDHPVASSFFLALRNIFVPLTVADNYIPYLKWKCLHRVFSSALQVLATQAMFRAIGIGCSRSFASAAAFNWVMKDGLGRLFRCIYTATLASAFDTNLKRVRFSTSIIFSLSIGLEMLTPAFPQYFLLIASIANTAKQISLACYLATNSAVHQSFAIADNLGEVSAKSQIQTVTFDNLGLLLAALLNILCKNNERLQAGLPFVAFPIFSALDLVGIYQGLKHVHLHTLTKGRLEILINTWIQLGQVPSPAEVSKVEGIDLFGIKGKESWPVRIGVLDSTEDVSSMLSVLAMQSLSNEDFYLICLENLSTGFKRSCNLGILLCVREGASTRDLILGMMQASYLRKKLLFYHHKMNNAKNHPSEMNKSEWFEYLRDSKQSAEADVDLFIEQMPILGWSAKNILLSTGERDRYIFVSH